MAVAVEGHGDRGVSEEFLYELRMDTAREQQGGAGVPQIVEAHVLQPGTLK
jgi:hypothetical protein